MLVSNLGATPAQLGAIVLGAGITHEMDTGQLGIHESDLGHTQVLGAQDGFDAEPAAICTPQLGIYHSVLGRFVALGVQDDLDATVSAELPEEDPTSQLGVTRSRLGDLFVLRGSTRDTTVSSDVSSTLSLSQTVAVQGVYNRSLTSVCTCSQLAQTPVPQSCTSPLSLSQAVDAVSTHQFVEHTLSLTSDARIPVVFDESITSSLTMGHSHLAGGTLNQNVSHSLDLQHHGDDILKYRDASNALLVSQTVMVEAVTNVGNTLLLSHSVVQGIINLSVVTTLDLQSRIASRDEALSHTISFAQQATTSGLLAESPESTLALTQTAEGTRTYHLGVETKLNFVEPVFDPVASLVNLVQHELVQQVETGHCPRTVPDISQFIPLVQTVVGANCRADAAAASASNTLALSQDVAITFVESVSNTFSLSHAVSQFKGHDASDTIVLTQTVTHTLEGTKGFSNAIGVAQAVAFLKVAAATGVNVECDYSPFVGDGLAGAPTPPPSALPTLEGLPADVRFRLQYPVDTPIVTLDLRAPNLGNRDRLNFQRINRETRGGTLLVFADPQWPKVQTLVFNFSGIKKSVATAFLTFLKDHLGKEIAIITHEGDKWRGVITNPDEAVVQDHIESYTLSFEFQGMAA